MGRKEVIQERIAELENELSQLNKIPNDEFEDKTVIAWERKYAADVTYTYVALKVHGRWWITGRNASTGMTYENLVTKHLRFAEWIAVASEWEQIA